MSESAPAGSEGWKSGAVRVPLRGLFGGTSKVPCQGPVRAPADACGGEGVLDTTRPARRDVGVRGRSHRRFFGPIFGPLVSRKRGPRDCPFPSKGRRL